MTEFINSLLEGLSAAISVNIWLAPLFALLAGLLTSVTPCSLSSVPLIIAYVGGAGQKDTKRSFRLSIMFAAGMAVTFTALGIAASLLGRLMQGAGSWWYLVLGVLMVLMALQTWEIFNFIPSSFAVAKNSKRGYLGAILAGILGGFFSSPCATPILIVLLAVVSKEGQILWGIILLLLYSIGHSVLVIVAGTSIGFVQRLSGSDKYGKATAVLKIFMGCVILLIAFYMFYLGF